MSRPRLPTETLAANGAFDKNPHRAADRVGTSPSPALSEPPADLPEDVRLAWLEITSHAPEGQLREAHFLQVRSAARLLAKENAAKISAQERAQLFKAYEQLGLTPRSESYVKRPVVKKDNPFANL